jgi:2-dehydro-3-deoxyphosphooctonate aldolase (KDO 8-P synthase)
MKLCGFDVGLDRRFFLIAGPCVIENIDHSLMVAEFLANECAKISIQINPHKLGVFLL